MVVSSFSKHHVNAEVRNPDDEIVWKLAGVYGLPETTNKHLTWELLENLWEVVDCRW